MQSALARTSGLAPFLSATAKTVPSKIEPLVTVMMPEKASFVEPSSPIPHSSYAMSKQLPKYGFLNPSVTSGIGGKQNLHCRKKPVLQPKTALRKRALGQNGRGFKSECCVAALKCTAYFEQGIQINIPSDVFEAKCID